MKGNKYVKLNKSPQSPSSLLYLTMSRRLFRDASRISAGMDGLLRPLDAQQQNSPVQLHFSLPAISENQTYAQKFTGLLKEKLGKQLRPFQKDECEAKASQLDYTGIFVTWIRLEVVAQNYLFMAVTDSKISPSFNTVIFREIISFTALTKRKFVRPSWEQKTIYRYIHIHTHTQIYIYNLMRGSSVEKTLEEIVAWATRNWRLSVAFIYVREQHCPMKGDKETQPQSLSRAGCW